MYSAIDPSEKTYAVEVDSLCKQYSRSAPVLKGLTLQVPMGKIYGLLGPSGCGKTTLLKCIVGRLKPDSGVIRVMGERPGKFGHRVPGNLLGYMPQELALFQSFTIAETMYYFGRIFHMESESIETQTDFLVALLELPSKNRLIGQLSIWDHLVSIVNNPEQPTSIVITTHYIEEARQGHMVALMRDGRLLAESTPGELLRRYNETSLETVFLKLCQLDSAVAVVPADSSLTGGTSSGDGAASETSPLLPKSPPVNHPTLDDHPQPTVAYTELVPWSESVRSFFAAPVPWHVLAVVGKNVNNLRRRIPFLAFQFILPIIQIVLFCVCVGGDPFGLQLAAVNSDTSGPLGAKFLAYLDNSTFQVTAYPDLETARSEVRNVHAWAVVYLGANFTRDFMSRMVNPAGATNDTLAGGSIHLQMDNSNYQVSLMVQKSVTTSFMSFAGDLLRQAGLPASLVSLPIVTEPPLLGSENPSFTEFMAPGMIVTIVFFMATGLTALSFVLERKEGLLDRSLVAGVTILELMLGHMLTQLIIMAGQTGILLFFSLVVFQVPCHGQVLWVILLALMNGFTGMSVGLLISVLSSEETTAIQAALGTMYPNLLLSGIIWPVEAMPVYLRYISKGLPISLSVEAMRSVLSRGFGFTAAPVYLGFVSAFAWATGLMLLALLLLRIRGV